MKKVLLLFLLLLLFSCGEERREYPEKNDDTLAEHHERTISSAAFNKSAYEIKEEKKAGEYTIRAWKEKPRCADEPNIYPGVDCIEIMKKDSVVMLLPEEDEKDSPYGFFETGDYTADGFPDIHVYFWSGGSHCCNNHCIFSLGSNFRQLFELQGEGCHFSFEQIDNDAPLRF